MGKVNVYLPNDLERAVRAAGLSISAICQAALQRELSALERLRSEGQAPYTPRLRAILDGAKADQARQGRDVTALDLAGAIARHGENLGARTLTALGIELPEPQPESAAAATDGHSRLAPDAVDVLTAAYKVAAEMRHQHLGTEHVVIALAAEDSPLHDVFSVLGISDRLVQQQVERLLDNPWTTDHAAPEDNTARLDRLDQEVQRIAAEIANLRATDA
ncbi:hypothetical protein G5C51_02315 [Streptomyces sp. A7024]|uniref:Clp R domain-containing protein n=1 Tax=Streptomyces coryli TaxID=1128680 RepID=A0A6G4TTE8_9ACTN|nr:Clp protease N-terminal domain-containing protein [Streptomyces coryli]NGN62736.1 hypothetical protein [Streptomyces coryli]